MASDDLIPDRIKDHIDPVYAHWLQATHAELPEGFTPSIEQMRAAFGQRAQSTDSPIDDSLQVINESVNGRDGNTIPVRRYSHKNATGAAATCVFVHGGGWVLGNLDTHNGLCGDIAMGSGLDVVAIDYRLSPENQFPAALNDCEDVVQALLSNASEWGIDTNRLVVFGDSAGANLATACCARLAQGEQPFKAQTLVYPALAANMDARSYTENADVPGLSTNDMNFFFTAYNGGEEPQDTFVAPLTLTSVDNMPPTLISVAEFDPLRDDGVAYADKLKAAGIKTTLRTEKGVGHSYLWLRNNSPVAKEAFAAQTAFLRASV